MIGLDFWCSKLQRMVHMDAEITARTVSIQVAEPQVCWFMRQHGCPYAESHNCLLHKEIQGNYREALEAIK